MLIRVFGGTFAPRKLLGPMSLQERRRVGIGPCSNNAMCKYVNWIGRCGNAVQRAGLVLTGSDRLAQHV